MTRDEESARRHIERDWQAGQKELLKDLEALNRNLDRMSSEQKAALRAGMQSKITENQERRYRGWSAPRPAYFARLPVHQRWRTFLISEGPLPGAADTEAALAQLPDWAAAIDGAMALYAKWARESPRDRVQPRGSSRR